MSDGSQRIVVTGAAGDVGARVVRHLRSLPGVTVVALDQRTGDGIVGADLCADPSEWAHHLEGATALLHLAGDRRPLAGWETLTPLNLDMLMTVCGTAARLGIPRIVIASSNYVLGGYRFGSERLAANTVPAPMGGYGATKLFAERFGHYLASQYKVSVVALRIGYAFSGPDGRMPKDAAYGRWGQEMWLSDGDLCRGMELALTAPVTGFVAVPLVSANRGSRWALEDAQKAIGFVPQDGQDPTLSPTQRLRQAAAHLFQFSLPRLSARLSGRLW